MAAASTYLHTEFSKLDTDRASSLALTPLNYSVKEYGELEHLLRTESPGATLRDAVTFFLAHNKTKKFTPRTVKECTDLFVAAQEAAGISVSQIATLKKHYKRFTADFGTRKINEVTSLEIDEWLNTRTDEKTGKLWSQKTRTSNRGSLVSVAIYSQKKLNAIPDGSDTEFQKATKPRKAHKAAVDIYTPEEMEQFLLAALEHDVDLIPVMVIGGFQGLRPSEVHGEGTDHPPLNWDAFIWHDEQIEIQYQKIRSKLNRELDIFDATKAWLAPFMDETGYIWRHKQAHSKKLISLREKCGVRSVDNGFRHSYASYRIRILKNDLNELAREMGNSPKEIIDSYKRNVKDSEAEKWFAIRPPVDYAETVKAFLELRKATLAEVVE